MKHNNLTYSYDEIIAILKEVEVVLISLHKMGSFYGDNWNEREYEKETARFIDECRITERLAFIRKIISSKFDNCIDSDDMSCLERACIDLKYWENPGDMLEEYRGESEYD